jgi:uncharacterized protein
MSSAESLVRIVAWRNLFADGTEYCTLWRTPEGWRLTGTAIAVLKDTGPLLALYSVYCDRQWHTQRVEAERNLGSDTRSILLTSDGRGGWHGPGQDTVQSCTDVDLAITPATNTLPVRRLNLNVKESREVRAAWIRFPDLSVQPLVQRYTRLSAD